MTDTPQIAAIRAALKDVEPGFEWSCDKIVQDGYYAALPRWVPSYCDAVSPAAISNLIAELDAKTMRISELEAKLIEQTENTLGRAENRIAELEQELYKVNAYIGRLELTLCDPTNSELYDEIRELTKGPSIPARKTFSETTAAICETITKHILKERSSLL